MKIANDPVKKRVEWSGIPIDVEWPVGSVRVYTDDDTGEITFRKPMYVDYGYIRGTDSADGEELDVYIGNAPEGPVYVIDQLVVPDSYEEEQGAEPGDHDEDKYMLGFESEREAMEAYQLHMTEEHFGGVYEMSFEQFQELIRHG